jgi:hypothetical protein
MSNVAHDDPDPLAFAVDFEICGHATVERERIAQRRHGALPRPNQRPEWALRWTDESVLCLWADEVRLRLTAGICALECEERAGGRERSTKGKRVAAVENALAPALRPLVHRALCACRFPPDDRVAGEGWALPQDPRLIRTEPGQERKRRDEGRTYHHHLVDTSPEPSG